MIDTCTQPSWYLDKLVAEQKRQVHQQLIRRWAQPLAVRRVLKTDLFEEAYGADQILFDLFPGASLTAGIDLSWATVRRASASRLNAATVVLLSDVRRLALADESFDLIVSTSTLDHFDSAAEFSVALELARVLRPGGLLIVTLDNPQNPMYPLLRWVSRRRGAPFRLGHTTSQSGLLESLRHAELEPVATEVLIHNPRLISTLLFLALRRLAGRRADPIIRGVLRLFAGLEHLPTCRFTACFIAACARKPCRPEPVNRSVPRKAVQLSIDLLRLNSISM